MAASAADGRTAMLAIGRGLYRVSRCDAWFACTGLEKYKLRNRCNPVVPLCGLCLAKIRDAHFAHHKHTGEDGDPDFDTAHPTQFWAWYWTFFRRYFGWQSLIYVNTVVGIYLFVFDIPFMQIFLLYGAPALLSSLQLFYFGTYRPHRHGEGAFADGHNARSDNFSTLASLASCFHFGYHLEHHRRPDVPWWALPGARRAGVAA